LTRKNNNIQHVGVKMLLLHFFPSNLSSLFKFTYIRSFFHTVLMSYNRFHDLPSHPSITTDMLHGQFLSSFPRNQTISTFLFLDSLIYLDYQVIPLISQPLFCYSQCPHTSALESHSLLSPSDPHPLLSKTCLTTIHYHSTE